MMPEPIHPTLRSPARLAALVRTGLMDSEPEPSFDRLARLASRVLWAPAAAVSLLDDTRQFFKSQVGLAEPWASQRGTPLSASYCQYVVSSGRSLCITNALNHPAVRDNPAIANHGMMAYLGVPLFDKDHYVLGSFCVMDTKPRDWSKEDQTNLRDLAESVQSEIFLRCDIAERRASQERARLSEDRVRSILKTALDCIITIDDRGRIIEFNPAAEQTYGRRREDVLGQDLIELTAPPELREVSREGFKFAITLKNFDGFVNRREESYGMRADGSRFPVEYSYSVQSDDNVLYFTFFLRDITARREAERDLKQAKEQAVAASRAKSQFLANMSHEVRTPLGAILGFAAMLQEGNLADGDHDHALAAIRRNGQHLLQLLNDVLDLSKVEAGKIRIDPTDHCPWQVVCDVISTLRAGAEAKGVSLHARPVAEIPRLIWIDPARLRQILVNLIDNAIKFTEAGGAVEVLLRADRQSSHSTSLCIEVHDQGIGMTLDQMERLYTPFHQADPSTTRKYGGTGLGLSISSHLARALGGSLAARSVPGQGSVFTLSLPVPAEAVWVEAAQVLRDDHLPRVCPPAGQPRRLQGRILLAEDNVDLRKVLGHDLATAGLEILEAENGRDAEAMALSQSVDLIILDMQMPVKDGYDVARSLRHAGFRHPILALTAHAMPEDRERCLQAGCSDYLSKPVDAGTLLAAVAEHLHYPQPSMPPGSRFDPEFERLKLEFARGLTFRVTEARIAWRFGSAERLQNLAHQLRGVGTTYGFPELTEAAGLVEDALRENRDKDLVDELVREFADLTGRIARVHGG